MKFWKESVTGRPYFKVDDLLIRPFHISKKNE